MWSCPLPTSSFLRRLRNRSSGLAPTENRPRQTVYTCVACVAALGLGACAGGTKHADEPRVGRYAYLYEEDTRSKATHELQRECPTLSYGAPGEYPIYLDDGVNRCEAYALGIHYFLRAGYICGWPSAPVERESCWLVPTYLGIGGTASLPIRIDKVSGTGRALYAEGEPSFPPVPSVNTGGASF